MIKTSHSGLFAAALTPFRDDGHVAVEQVGPLVEYFVDRGVQGVYVCGSTGEGPSLKAGERRELAEAFVREARGKLTVIVQVGHNSVEIARQLAAHAESIGADAISANCPSYFHIESLDVLVETSAHVAAAAPKTPFYYYHIPRLTGAQFSMSQYLESASPRIPNLAGMKFTSPEFDEFALSLAWQNSAARLFWGVDEALLPALSLGATGAIGSTYNVAGRLFRQLMSAFADGDLKAARQRQLDGIRLIHTVLKRPFVSALKSIITRDGIPMGGARLPNRTMTAEETERFLAEVDALGVL